jgi:hypothetical protein
MQRLFQNMKRDRSNHRAPSNNRSPSKRVLVHLVDAPKLPYYFPAHAGNCLMMHRPADWHTFGMKACDAEEERRESLVKLLTPDEINVLYKYWNLRDS